MNRWIAGLAAGVLAALIALPVGAAPAAVGVSPKKPSGQQGKGKKGGGELKRLQTALGQLNLTPEQKSKTDKLVADVRAKGKALREGPGTAEEKKSKLRELRKSFREKLAAVLTDPQKKKLKELMDQAKKQQAAKTAKKPG